MKTTVTCVFHILLVDTVVGNVMNIEAECSANIRPTVIDVFNHYIYLFKTKNNL